MLEASHPMAPFALGFVLGLRHALDSDHLAAMATIVSRERGVLRSAILGGWWGLGHTSSLLVGGAAVSLLGAPIPESWTRWFELGVAAMLVVLGALAIWSRHGAPARPTRSRPFTVGVVHGLAGTSAAVLLLAATAGSPWRGMLTILWFGLGSVVGMMAMSAAFSLPLALSAGRIAPRAIRILAGLGSIAFGVYYAYQAA
jgi:high-affinity nickel-transport protein